jgi:hypothetical protein
MIVALLLVALSAVLLLVVVRAAHGHRIAPAALSDPGSQIRTIDMEAFRNLVDPEDEAYLRSVLPSESFRALKRHRLQVTTAYVRSIAYNAAWLLRFGEMARQSPDPEIASAGQQLAANALRLRLSSFLVLARLHMEIWLPGATTSAVRVVSAYEQLRDLSGRLARLQTPARRASSVPVHR